MPRNAIALTDPAGSEELQQGTAERRGRKPLHQGVGAEMVFRHRQQVPLRLGNDLLDSPDRLAVLREDLATQQQLGVNFPHHVQEPGMRLMTLPRSQSCQSNKGVSRTSSASSMSTPISFTLRQATRYGSWERGVPNRRLSRRTSRSALFPIRRASVML